MAVLMSLLSLARDLKVDDYASVLASITSARCFFLKLLTGPSFLGFTHNLHLVTNLAFQIIKDKNISSVVSCLHSAACQSNQANESSK